MSDRVLVNLTNPPEIVSVGAAGPRVKHVLKSWVGLYEPLASGAKPFDLRVMDRDYQVGDICEINEWQPRTRTFTGRKVLVEITYITSGQHVPCYFSPIALHPDMAVLGIKLLDRK